MSNNKVGLFEPLKLVFMGWDGVGWDYVLLVWDGVSYQLTPVKMCYFFLKCPKHLSAVKLSLLLRTSTKRKERRR